MRTDSAKRQAQELRAELERIGARGLGFGAGLSQAEELANASSDRTGAEVAVEFTPVVGGFPDPTVRATSPTSPQLLDRRVRGVPAEPTVINIQGGERPSLRPRRCRSTARRPRAGSGASGA